MNQPSGPVGWPLLADFTRGRGWRAAPDGSVGGAARRGGNGARLLEVGVGDQRFRRHAQVALETGIQILQGETLDYFVDAGTFVVKQDNAAQFLIDFEGMLP